MVQTDKRAIFYLRLSSEDDAVDGGLQDESNSISNQRRLLSAYMKAHPELGREWEEVVDDGFSGTNLQRPGMQRLIDMIKNDQVRLIMVKDLSRFGRNYLEIGYLIELFMPLYHVRLIAVNDNYDTAEQEYSAGDIGLALNNLKNEYYSRDLSRKLKSTIELRRDSGKFYNQWPYGYLYHKKDKSVSIDHEAAVVVQTIFHLAAVERINTVQIAKQLNEQGVPSPSTHLAVVAPNKRKVAPYWTGQTVHYILTNRIYTGCHERHRLHVVEIGARRTHTIPREQREYVRNTHEAIISEEMYEEAQQIICRRIRGKHDRSIRGQPLPPEEMLHPYLQCGCCGRKLYRKHISEPFYYCKAGKVRVDGYCKDIRCNAVEMEQIVFQAVLNLVSMVSEEQMRRQREQEALEQQSKEIKNSIRSLTDKRKLFNGRKMKLYERFRSGEITLQQFKAAKEHEAAEEQTINNEIERLNVQLAEVREQIEAAASETELPDCPIGDRLTPEVLEAFVAKVVIHENNEPEIILKCVDVFDGLNQ